MNANAGAARGESVADFIAGLVKTMRELKRPEPSRLMVAVFKGTASRQVLQGYALEQYAFLKFVVHCIASALGRMLERDNFLTLSANFSREVGFYQTPNHVDSFVKFGEALGLTRERMVSHVPLPETLGAMYTLSHFCHRSAAEAVAAFSLATEARGDILNENRRGERQPMQLSKVFRERHGLSEEAVEFYRIHEAVEGEDAEQGFAMIRPYADGAYNQALIRTAVVHTALTFDAMWYAWDRFVGA